MYQIKDLVQMLEAYGVRLSVVDADTYLWEATEFRGVEILPPVQIGLHSDEAVAEYVENYRKPRMRSGLPLELAMMNIVEVVESTNGTDDEPVFAAFLLTKRPGSAVKQVWQRRQIMRAFPVVPDSDLKWRADEDRSGKERSNE